jgi:hypothetical protein
MTILELASVNLLSPMVLFFVLGLSAALARSDLAFPEAAAKAMALYLMMAIGFKGGASVADAGASLLLVTAVVAGLVLSAALPVIAFGLLRRTTSLSRIDAAAIAAHYGSISIVTFLAATEALKSAGISFEGYLVAVAAAMEAPAILVALWLAKRNTGQVDAASQREILLNGSIVMLIGSFLIGAISGKPGLEAVAPFIVDPFKGVLCLFLLDMGVIAGRGFRDGRNNLSAGLVAFGLYMPLIGATLGLIVAKVIGLSTGGAALLATLSASASYIAVPAAMRIALPEAKPSLYLPLSLGVTFPFNLAIGIPSYIALAVLII